MASKGIASRLDGKRTGRGKGVKGRPLSILAMKWAAKWMLKPVVGEPIPGDPDQLRATENTLGAVRAPSDLHLVFWQMAQDPKTRPDFIKQFVKEEIADSNKNRESSSRDPDPEKTQGCTKLVDGLIRDWESGKGR